MDKKSVIKNGIPFKAKVGIICAFIVAVVGLIAVSSMQASEPEVEVVNNRFEGATMAEVATEKVTRPPEEKVIQPERSAFTEKQLSNVEGGVTSRLEAMDFNGTFLVSVGDEIVYHKAFGYSDAEKKIKNKLDTKYEIGSCTKQFTATAVAKLAQEKKLSLDDDVTKYLPKAKIAKGVKVYQLMNMCSGMPDYLNEFIYTIEAGERSKDKKLTQKEFLNWLNQLEPNFEAGEYFAYSNTNYYLLGLIIEKVTGKTYEEYINDEILYPLYMDNSSMKMSDTNCKGYLDSNYTQGIKMDSSIFYSAGEMVSTTTDMLKWVNAFSRGKVLQGDMLTQATHSGKDGFGYGFGWFGCDDYYYHTGNTELYYAIDVVTREDDIKVIGLSNVNDTSLQQNALIILQVIENELFPNKHNTEPPTEKPTQQATQQ